MEGFAAALAAERITEEGIEKLSQANDNYKKAVLSGDASEMIKYDTMFHKIIVDACDNNILDQMIVQLQDRDFCAPPLLFGRRPPQSNCLFGNVPLRVPTPRG